jgi:hypothetical protein
MGGTPRPAKRGRRHELERRRSRLQAVEERHSRSRRETLEVRHRGAVLTSSPPGCTGGAPVTSQTCTCVPPIDGAALYTQLCSGCHGNSKKDRPASAIQGAIDGNVGGMGSAALRALTPAQVAAIAAAP